MKRACPQDIPERCAAVSQVDTLQKKLMESGGQVMPAKREAAREVGQLAITSCDCTVSSLHHNFIIPLSALFLFLCSLLLHYVHGISISAPFNLRKIFLFLLLLFRSFNAVL
jgi:hypothetical protein